VAAAGPGITAPDSGAARCVVGLATDEKAMKAKAMQGRKSITQVLEILSITVI